MEPVKKYFSGLFSFLLALTLCWGYIRDVQHGELSPMRTAVALSAVLHNTPGKVAAVFSGL